MKSTTRERIGMAITEALENRQLYSTVSLDSGVLTLALDAPGRAILDTTARGQVWAYAGGKHAHYQASEIKSVKVIGSDGADNVYIDPRLKVPTEMHLGAGNDWVRGSGGEDVIYAGAGNDVIYARGGDDVVDAESGDDVVWGDGGNDSLYGGAGSDNLQRGDGTNVIDQDGSYAAPTVGNNNNNDGPKTPATGGAGNGNPSLPPSTPVDTGTGPVKPTVPTAPPVATKPTSPVTPTVPTTPTTPIDNNNDDSTDASAPTVKQTLITSTVAAGHSIHAHGLETVLRSGTILTAKFEWNFGDGKTMVGWNVGHTYAKAGTYQLSLKVTDEAGRSTTSRQAVTITAENRKKVYVSRAGNDNNDGLTEATALRTAGKAAGMINDNTEVLFRRGDKFEVAEAMAIADRNVVIGAYGTGERPVLWRLEGNGRSTITMWTNSVEVTVRDLTFDSQFAANGGVADKIPVDAIVAGGRNVTVSGCQFLNVTDAVNSNRQPTGLLVENNTAPLIDGVRGYMVWGEGSDHVYVGNQMANSTREHGFRMVGMSRVNITNNRMDNPGRAGIDYGDIAKGSIEMHRGQYFYINGNTVDQGALRTGPRGGETEAKTTSTDWVVIENNTVINVAIQLRSGSHHVVVRNNLIQNENAEAVKIFAADLDGRVSSDITIDNNTAVNHGTRGKFLLLEGKAESVTLTHNLFVAPNLTPADSATAAVYVGMSDLSAFRNISGNVWPDAKGFPFAKGGINYVGTSWGYSDSYRTASAWEAYDVVRGDQFTNVPEGEAMYSLKIGSDTIGSTLRMAA